MNDLVKLTKEFLKEEYSPGDCVLADVETCNHFRDHFKKQMSPQQQVKPMQQPVMRNVPAPAAPPVPKLKPTPVAPPKMEKQLIKPPQTIDHSEFKKMLTEHFPNVSIVDPTSS